MHAIHDAPVRRKNDREGEVAIEYQSHVVHDITTSRAR
jgi:hypothetical protein